MNTRTKRSQFPRHTVKVEPPHLLLLSVKRLVFCLLLASAIVHCDTETSERNWLEKLRDSANDDFNQVALTNSWAVELRGSPSPDLAAAADVLASKHGLVNLGQVSRTLLICKFNQL